MDYDLEFKESNRQLPEMKTRSSYTTEDSCPALTLNGPKLRTEVVNDRPTLLPFGTLEKHGVKGMNT